MRRRAILLLLAGLGVLGALPISASASANPTHGACIAQFTSNQGPGEVGATVKVVAHEAHPLGQVIVSQSGQLKPPCE